MLDLQSYQYDAIVLVVLLFALGASKLRFVVYSTQFFHTLLFLPIFQALSCAGHAASGVLYFHELDANTHPKSKVNLPMYGLGMGLLVVGLALNALKFDPNVHMLEEQMGHREDKESLMNSNMDAVYGQPTYGDGQSRGPGRREEKYPSSSSSASRYPSQGHSGEIRRGEITRREPAVRPPMAPGDNYGDLDEYRDYPPAGRRPRGEEGRGGRGGVYDTRAAPPGAYDYGYGDEEAPSQRGGRSGPGRGSARGSGGSQYADYAGLEGGGRGGYSEVSSSGTPSKDRRAPAGATAQTRGGGRALYSGGLQY